MCSLSILFDVVGQFKIILWDVKNKNTEGVFDNNTVSPERLKYNYCWGSISLWANRCKKETHKETIKNWVAANRRTITWRPNSEIFLWIFALRPGSHWPRISRLLCIVSPCKLALAAFFLTFPFLFFF
jgi:hypothetical protein